VKWACYQAKLNSFVLKRNLNVKCERERERQTDRKTDRQTNNGVKNKRLKKPLNKKC
jgi:hypothetical protein